MFRTAREAEGKGGVFGSMPTCIARGVGLGLQVGIKYSHLLTSNFSQM